ncbi:MAG: GGDEF domain-containing protein [Gammaproteobacteria bacterium]
MQNLEELINPVNECSEECPAGDDSCPHFRELKRLRDENKELAALVRTDELTGLFNFRYFLQAVELEMERSRRSDQPTTLIMMDIDHFKDFNDAYGHEAGNKALASIARVLKNAIRRLDIPCRYGGEEFAIILPDTPLSAGVMFANRLRHLVERARIQLSGTEVQLTSSFGVDTFTKNDEASVYGFIERVDKLLYDAKTEGRNQVQYPPFDVNRE